MKQSFVQKMILGALMSVSLGLAACAKQDSSSASRIAGRGGAVVTSNACSNGQSNVGRVYDPNASYDGSAFESQVKGLVSATMDPNSFGTISGASNASTGMNISLALKYDASGNITMGSSSMLLTIVDSYVGMCSDGTNLTAAPCAANAHVIQPYQIQFANAASGTLSRTTGQFTVTFTDSYGSIMLQGSVTGSYATGTVTFQNTTSTTGYPASGSLGSFQVPICGVIN